MMSKRMKSFILTFVVYIVGKLLLDIIAYFTNWFHVSDLVYCFAFILGSAKMVYEVTFIDEVEWKVE